MVKKLSLFVVSLISVMFIAGSVFAQPGMPGGMPGGNRVERLKEALSLTDQQVEKISALIKTDREEMWKQMESSGDNNTPQSFEKRTDALNAKIAQVLTAEQKTKFTEYAKLEKDPAAMRTENLTKRLKLTDDQKKKVYNIISESQAAMKKSREQADDDRGTGSRKQMRKDFEEADKKIEALLTKEQAAEFKKMREEQKQEMRERMRERRDN